MAAKPWSVKLLPVTADLISKIQQQLLCVAQLAVWSATYAQGIRCEGRGKFSFDEKLMTRDDWTAIGVKPGYAGAYARKHQAPSCWYNRLRLPDGAIHELHPPVPRATTFIDHWVHELLADPAAFAADLAELTAGDTTPDSPTRTDHDEEVDHPADPATQECPAPADPGGAGERGEGC